MFYNESESIIDTKIPFPMSAGDRLFGNAASGFDFASLASTSSEYAFGKNKGKILDWTILCTLRIIHNVLSNLLIISYE